VAWHRADRGRTVLAAEQPFQVELTVAGERVLLRGFLDRVELDSQGRVVVVDLKTGRTTPSGAAVRQHPQLGVYQLAVAHGALSELTGPAAPPGGAELVHLRHDAQGSGLPRVQRQEPPDEGDAPIHAQLASAVRALRDEEFVATPGDGCRYCEFRACCPAQPEGLTIVAAPREAS
jgi:RecB family exonuclease